MIQVLIGIFTVVLILVALFLILVVLAQPASSDGGMAPMGGGMMESTFGPDSTNVLSGMTIKATIAFFAISLLLYLGYVYVRAHPEGNKGALPNISAPATPLPKPSAAPAPAAAPHVAVPLTAAPNAATTTKPSGPAPKSP